MHAWFRYLHLILFISLSPKAFAQNYEDIVWDRHIEEHGYSWQLPADWYIDEDKRFVAVMWAADDTAYCSLKRTADWAFNILTPKTYVTQMVENPAQIKDMLAIQYPQGDGNLVRLSAFPVGNLEGLMFLTSGTMDSQPMMHAGFQTIFGGAVFTLSCFTLQENFGYYFPIFTQIADKLHFQS
ncbi:hypothetical protein A8B83_19525 [Rhodobacteraceae bacterium EhC02]|nr:hypothetical protein A8B83_19525 [Rhodobacteraceae bacterium EhC02]